MPVKSGTYNVLICTDVYSQVRRFAPSTSCAPTALLAIATSTSTGPSGRVPDTIIRTAAAGASGGSTAVFRFASSVRRSTFECRLDGAPWVACSSPHMYKALVVGAHDFEVRAISPSGKPDPIPARAKWAVGAADSALTLRSPMSGTATSDDKPAFSGTAGTAAGDSSTITLKLFSASRARSRVRTLTATASGGAWSVTPIYPLQPGTYSAQAEQSTSSRITRVSALSTFTINPAVTSLGIDAAAGTSTPNPAPSTSTPNSAPSTYSIGGTISGLSGTVVLQDNGGDDLSISSNGPFTFTTPVVGGAGYDVTVASSSSGQTCTTSGGAGTVSSANVTSVVISCAPPSYHDDFNRADGDLGAGWVSMSDGALSIASQQVESASGALAGDTRAGERYGNDQYSRVTLTPTQLTNGEWVGPAVRSQNGGQDLYLGIYFWNYGNPQLRLYKRTGGSWTQLGSSYNSGDLPAGTQLTISAVASRISFQEDGTERIAATDTTITGGAPGVMTYGTAVADDWSGGTPAKYTIGGTASGLSGTVVLQDDGGDDLSISGNGAFTFSTPLADGTVYRVSFKSAPGGQTCTSSGAAGTVASANVTKVEITCAASTSVPFTDKFNRADGDLGAGWVPMSDGGLSIASQQIQGTAGALAGDVRVAESYGSDQYSQIEVTSTDLANGEWVGPAVRSQNGGQDLYLGIYFWNYGDQQLRLYKRTGGQWVQLGSSYDCGPLSAGTTLTLSAVGSKISFQEDGVERVGAIDTTLTGGAPGVMTYDAATAGNWAGGAATAAPPPPLSIQYRSTDANGVNYYDVRSADDGFGTQTLRIVQPTNPAPGVPHNFLYVLPVEPQSGTTYGDGIDTLLSQDAQDKYNLTIIEPSFPIDPWYADNPSDPSVQFETFLTKDLVPWVTRNFSEPAPQFGGLAGHEQNWLIGFSKSGLGAEDLILRHPDLFAVAASWDFPADTSSYDQFGPSSADVYGTDSNFQANYRLTPSFVDAHKAPFLNQNRIWIGGYFNFQGDVADYDALLSSEGVLHTTETPQPMAHRWDSGWVPAALSALSQDSAMVAGTS